jgi:HK97 family phage major capsid protein
MAEEIKPDPAAAKEAILKELGNIKEALEANQKKAIAEQDKNLDEKLKAANEAIELLKNAKPEFTAADFEKLKDDLSVTIKALDVLQTRQKAFKGNMVIGEDTSFKGILGSSIEKLKDNIHGDKIKGGSFVTSMQLKAVGDMTIAANLTGSIPNTYRDGIVPVPFEMVHMRSLVSVTPSATDSYHFYRHTQGEGSIEFQVQELETKQQIDEDLAEQTVNLNYLAGWLRISRKMLRNFIGLQGYLTRWLPERYYDREDTKAYQALISAATGVADSSGTDIVSVIIRTIGKQKKAKYNVNGIVIDGEVWAKLLTYKASSSGEFTQPIGVVTISPTGQLMICGVPVYTASWVGGDEALIGDWRFFEIIQSEGLSLQFFDQDGTNVRENKITARIEASVGFAILDPKAFVVAALESVS